MRLLPGDNFAVILHDWFVMIFVLLFSGEGEIVDFLFVCWLVGFVLWWVFFFP